MQINWEFIRMEFVENSMGGVLHKVYHRDQLLGTVYEYVGHNEGHWDVFLYDWEPEDVFHSVPSLRAAIEWLIEQHKY